MNANQPPRIVFFDGVCGLCDRSVTFLLARDRAHRLSFAPLQGETAACLLPERLRTPPFDTLVFLSEGAIYERSSAVLRVGLALGGGWRTLRAFLWIPAFLRDVVYRLVASHRYQIFGKSEACRLPSPEERRYFLP